MRNYKYLIVGSSVAAVSAVKALRKADPDGSLAIISEELNPTYSRPLIYELLCKKMKEKEITFCEPGFFNIFKVEPILGIKALSLHTGACNVHLSNGEEIGYGKLLIATGGKPIAPPVQGVDLKNVFTFTSLGDVKKMGRSLSGVQTCLVIGGGLIGLQVSEAFLKMGKKVHIVELLDRLLAPILDKEGSAIAQEVLTRQGAIIHTSVAAQEILGGKNKKVRAVKLSNGEEIPADLVVLAVGVRPNTELVKGVNITVNKGILVDKHMETSLKGLFAAGDEVGGMPWSASPGAFTMGWRAGEMAAQEACRQKQFFDVSPTHTDALGRLIQRMTGNGHGHTWHEAEIAIQNIVDYYADHFRSEKMLQRVLHRAP